MKGSSGRSFDIPILMYHDVQRPDPSPIGSYTLSLQAFERQLDFLSRARRVISFQSLFNIMEGREPRTGKEVIITFDDGYESFRTLALPALVARGLTATVFVVASQIGGYNKWDVDAGLSRDKRSLMDEEALKEVIDAGMEIGVHGWAHRDMTRCSNEELSQEILDSKQRIERQLGVKASVFAYPYGKFNESHFDLLKEAGYLGAVSIFSDQRYVTSNPFAMRRVYVHANDGMARFRLKLSSAYLRYKAYRGIPRERNDALDIEA
jgi:peptidoglycan/xylan/chitin deacetylase (PgdA/CDA1 family)